jgi:CheY-like chemotaxis protein
MAETRHREDIEAGGLRREIQTTPPTVLIVDDDPVTVDQFSQILELTGYNVITAADGPEGLRQASQRRPDLLIVDLQMPVMTGADMLEQLRQIPHLREVPAVVVTGDYVLGDALATRLQTLGAEVKFKPLWLDDLVDIVTALLPGQPPVTRRAS